MIFFLIFKKKKYSSFTLCNPLVRTLHCFYLLFFLPKQTWKNRPQKLLITPCQTMLILFHVNTHQRTLLKWLWKEALSAQKAQLTPLWVCVVSWELPGQSKWFSGAAVIKFNGSASGALLLNLAMLIEFQVTILFLVNNLLKLLMLRPSQQHLKTIWTAPEVPTIWHKPIKMSAVPFELREPPAKVILVKSVTNYCPNLYW